MIDYAGIVCPIMPRIEIKSDKVMCMLAGQGLFESFC